MTNALIVPLEENHLDVLAALEAEQGDVHWTRDHFARELSSEVGRFFVIVENHGDIHEEIVGYGGYWKAGPEAQITNLVIRKDHQCQGLGRRLLEFLLDCARGEICEVSTLEVRAMNAHAQRLYEKIGYREVGRRKAIYKNPDDDAVLMEINL